MKSLIVIHHSSIVSDKPQFDSINTYHKKKGFPRSELGFYCGYHWIIERDGEVVQARKAYEMGAHTRVLGQNYNRDGIGICMAGNFTTQAPSSAQLDSLHKLCESLVDRFDLADESIIEHRDVKATACPGYKFADDVRYYLRSKRSKSFVGTFSPKAQLKRLHRALNRSQGHVKDMLRRTLERLLKRL